MRDFPSLFKGREDAHGHYFSLAGKDATDRGKIVSKAESVHDPVTPALFQKHLAGKDRLGIIPVRADGKTGWFCIDVDFYKIGNKTLAEAGGYPKIAKAIEKLGLKLLITRSKSGGAHLWCFLEEPIPAAEANKAAKLFFKKLNLADALGIEQKELEQHVDLFPKDFSPNNIGSWVNLPYFGEACHCVGLDGKQDLSLEKFVFLANNNLTHPDDLNFKVDEKAANPNKAKSGRPPCIDYMIENNVPEGHRDDAVTHFAIYALKAFPDTWEEETRAFNEQHCEPPLNQGEINKTLKSVGSRQYEGYMCKKIENIFCDKSACRKREFGIGKDTVTEGGEELGIEHIEKIDGEEPVYLLTMFGKTFPVNLVDLYLYVNFRRRAMGATNKLIPALKQPEWEEILSEKLEMMEVTEAAVDTQMRDRVIKQFQNWCDQGVATDSLEAALTANSPFYTQDSKGNGSILFSGDALLSQLDRQLRVSRDQAYVYMRGWGTVVTEVTVKGKKIKLWKWVQRGPLWFDPYRGKKK